MKRFKGVGLTFESSKDGCGLSRTASSSSTGDEVAKEDCSSDESGEPEEHCQALNTADDPWMGEAFESPRRKAQVDQGEKRPNRTKHEEVDRRG